MSRSLFKKNQISIPLETSDQMLQNILEACDMQPNMIPFDELVSYNSYRNDRLRIYKALLFGIIALFIMFPLLFIAPEIEAVTQAGDDEPLYNIEVDSLLSIRTVTATIDGKSIPVYENKAGVYSVEPGTKGTLVVTVTAINGQYANKKILVTDVDKAAPFVDSYTLADNNLSLKIGDSITGVDFDTVSITDEEGKVHKPISIDENSGIVVFSYVGGDITLSVKDKAGNELRLLLTDDR